MQEPAETLLLVTHVAIRQGANGLQIDDQTAAGIAQWCRYFDKVTYYGIAADEANANASSTTWVDVADSGFSGRCELVALPRAYRLTEMLKEYRGVRKALSHAITTHSHLCFTFGGLFGDWPAVAAREAIRQNRRYCAWIDRVEALVIDNKLRGASMKRRLLWTAARPLVEYNTQYLLQRSAVALLQGLDTFEYYARFSRDPHCTYDTHTHISDQITPTSLAEKQARILRGEPISVVYVGRAAEMKGPMDWLDTLERLSSRNVPFKATWIGDGPELPRMKARAAELSLSEAVLFPGFEGNREALLKAMRDSDLLLFCHKTRESPRCLIEALVSGCPLVGYDMAYPRGLVQDRGGAVLTPLDDPTALADRIVELHEDRTALSRLVADAAASGEIYNEDAVYGDRANLMKRA